MLFILYVAPSQNALSSSLSGSLRWPRRTESRYAETKTSPTNKRVHWRAFQAQTVLRTSLHKALQF